MLDAVIAWVASLPWWIDALVPIGWIVFWITRRDRAPQWTPDSDVEAEFRDRMGW